MRTKPLRIKAPKAPKAPLPRRRRKARGPFTQSQQPETPPRLFSLLLPPTFPTDRPR